jgi:hypothetical protein
MELCSGVSSKWKHDQLFLHLLIEVGLWLEDCALSGFEA